MNEIFDRNGNYFDMVEIDHKGEFYRYSFVSNKTLRYSFTENF